MFEIKPTKAYKLTNENLFEKNGLYPVVTNSSTNNGVTGYTNLLPTEKGNMITYSDTTTSDGIFYQPTDYVGYSHIQGLYPLIYKEKWKYKSLMYIVTCFRKVASGRFDYGNKFNRNIAKEMFIQLPTKDGKIDFEFMDAYISELEEERISELAAYLKVSGVDNYELSSEEMQAIENITKIKWGEYRIGDLFDSENGDFDIQKSHINDLGEYVITAGLSNNGVLGKTNINAKIIDGNTITIDMFGNAFYRKFKYKMVTHARVFSLIPKFNMSEKQGLYIVNSFKYLMFVFGYENMCSWAKIQNNKIQLPTKDGKIDFEFMNLFISAVKKLVIKDVVLYADKKINTTKQVTQNR